MKKGRMNLLRSLIHKNKVEQERLNTLLEMQTTQLSILSSISAIYLSVHLMDMENNLVVEINTSKEISELAVGNGDPVEEMKLIINHTIVPEYLERALAFTNLQTVVKRLKGKKIISEELLGRFHGWIRASFITVETDENEIPVKILFTTQIIDSEKRRVERLVETANRDELTGLHNRHAYEDELKSLNQTPPAENFVYVSMDVNGLKVANDTLGHAAGDELLCGAADCIQKCFGRYGHIYRTGGDEFQALIYADSKQLDEIKQQFEVETEKWSGNYVSELKISAGYVCMGDVENNSIAEIVKLADQRMYKAKSAYYSAKGMDRRGQQVAYEILCNSYAKILKADLVKDSFTVILINEDEKETIKRNGPVLSQALYKFATEGNVHEDDRYEYLSSLSLSTLRDYFEKGNPLFSIQYRRRFGSTFKKVLMEIIPAKDYSKDNQVVFLCVKNIEKNN